MSKKGEQMLSKENVVQAVLVADDFQETFLPLTNDIPICLFPLLNKPLLDYTLEFLSLSGIEELFLFCCQHVEAIKNYLKESEKSHALWTVNVKVHVLVSESCRSFGDCLRDLDAKGLIRGDFVLLEPGVVSNIRLLPILNLHKETAKRDRGTAITLVYQEAGLGQIGRSLNEELVLAVDHKNRVLYYKRVRSSDKQPKVPLNIFLENEGVSLLHNLRDTHIAICSPSVLPLFSDNFDFQTRDDFVRGLLMNEEILGSTVYHQLVKETNYGGAATDWQNFQALSVEVKNNWCYPIVPDIKNNNWLANNVFVSKSTKVPDCAKLSRCFIGENVTLGRNIVLNDCFVMSNTIIGDNVQIDLAVIGPDCLIQESCEITKSTIVGAKVVLNKGTCVGNELIQMKKPDSCDTNDILGKKAFKLRIDDEDKAHLSGKYQLVSLETLKYVEEAFEEGDGFSDSDNEELSYTQSPPPDDTKLFFTEVIDSLTRGFEDQLQCENLILEINSSRYAYNVTVKEVNFNVVKAILHMYLRQRTGHRFFSQLLSFFAPILKKYIRNEDAMCDCLQAIEDVALIEESISDNWVLFALKWLYSKDVITEEAILKWGHALDEKSDFKAQIKPFLDWLEQAEEESSSADE